MHAIRKEKRTAGDCSQCSQKNLWLYVPFPLSRNVSCEAQQGRFLFNRDICELSHFLWKKLTSSAYMECFMWSIRVFARARNMVSKTNHARCHGNPCQSKEWGFSCKSLCTFGGPAAEQTQCLGWGWEVGGIRVISEWKLISFGSNAWLLKFHLKALNLLRKIDGKHETKDAFLICLTDEIWSVRPPCNVFNKMSTRENNTTSNHKKIFF